MYMPQFAHLCPSQIYSRNKASTYDNIGHCTMLSTEVAVNTCYHRQLLEYTAGRIEKSRSATKAQPELADIMAPRAPVKVPRFRP
ncbi:hypothetical protein PGT21_030295 [Puccinia graminis f. sp. tritici]|uniref:Uncharacterized protein n=1 Tax=Puccinia graminis f. sp. tritici TaxID=56615 RepID=A0A5B0MPC2_PUCGR|nr:hypothetical protein PGT21_030295 [Puccinia graminis f. sp. tritici]